MPYLTFVISSTGKVSAIEKSFHASAMSMSVLVFARLVTHD